MKDQWTDNLRQLMEAHQEPAPDGLWDDIERVVKTDNSINSTVRHRKVLLWGRYVSAAAAIILVVFLLHLFRNDDVVRMRNDNIPARQAVSDAARNNAGTTPVNVYVPSAQSRNGVLAYSNVAESVNSRVVKNASKSVSPLELHNVDTVKTVMKNEIKSSLENSQAEVASNKDKDRTNGRTETFDDNFADMLPRKSTDVSPSGWVTGLYASNFNSSSSKGYDGYDSFSDESNLLDPVFQDILEKGDVDELNTTVRHHQPITIGASVGYNFNERWSVTTGVFFTKLTSDISSGDKDNYSYSEQTLYDVGIPVNVNFNVWRYKKLTTYVSMGGSVEKNVSGTLSTKYVVKNNNHSFEKTNISIKSLQWSVNSAVGLQYNLLDRVGAFVEPGISHYFDNGSKKRTVYNEKSLNFNLRVGLRFTLGD